MMAYAQVYGCRELMLVYPHHAGLPAPAGRLAAHGVVNLECSRLQLVTLDLAVPGSVREQLGAAVGGFDHQGVW